MRLGTTHEQLLFGGCKKYSYQAKYKFLWLVIYSWCFLLNPHLYLETYHHLYYLKESNLLLCYEEIKFCHRMFGFFCLILEILGKNLVWGVFATDLRRSSFTHITNDQPCPALTVCLLSLTSSPL